VQRQAVGVLAERLRVEALLTSRLSRCLLLRIALPANK
jgi:hypothetical protein